MLCRSSLRVLVLRYQIPVLGHVLIVLTNPGCDSNFRCVKPQPGNKIQEIARNVLDAIHVPDDDEGCDLVRDHAVAEPRVLVLYTVHPLHEFLDKGRVVVPPDRGGKDQDIAGKHRVLHVLHPVIVILQ